VGFGEPFGLVSEPAKALPIAAGWRKLTWMRGEIRLQDDGDLSMKMRIQDGYEYNSLRCEYPYVY